MTGFGRSHLSRDGREAFMELKSVNHRYLDLSFRLPKPLAFAEEPLRGWIRDADIKRGHLEVSVTYCNSRADAKTVALDRGLVLQCARETQDVADTLLLDGPSVAELIRLCDALTVTQAEEDTDELLKLLEEAFAGAFTALQAMRQKEGGELRDDLQRNLDDIRTAAARISQLAPAVPQEYRDKLLRRMAEWRVEIADPARIAQEVALMADKCAIDEELSRLQSHFRQFSDCLKQDGEIGRRMDFLLQEMNREINTIGSKASHAEITSRVVEMKCALEKLREQVQNIE